MTSKLITQRLPLLIAVLVALLAVSKSTAADHPEIVERLADQWQTWADRVEALRHGQP